MEKRKPGRPFGSKRVPEDTKQIWFRVSDEVHEILKLASKNNKRTIGQTLDLIIQDHIATFKDVDGTSTTYQLIVDRQVLATLETQGTKIATSAYAHTGTHSTARP